VERSAAFRERLTPPPWLEINRVLDAFQLSHEPVGMADLAKLRRGHPDKVRCAALVRMRTAMENNWIAARLALGGSTYVSSLVNRLLRDAKERRTLAAHERALDAENEKVEK